MNSYVIKKLLNVVFLFLAGFFLPYQLSAQCDSLKVDFSFSYLSGDTLVLLNQSEHFDSYQWKIEGGEILEQFEHSLFVLRHTDTLTVCLTGRQLDDCEKTICQEIFPGHQKELCLQTDCIWPGDANGDRSANQYDLLNIGLGFGTTGPERMVFPVPEDPIYWAPTYNTNWEQAVNLVNYKHLDCDGNGIIDEADLIAIQKNYTPASSLQNTITGGAAPVDLQLKSSVDYLPDSSTRVSIIAELNIGSMQLPVENLHGLALRLRFPNQPFQIAAIQTNIEDTDLLGATEKTLSISRRINQGEKQDFFDLALSKKNTLGSSGFGKAVSIRIISADIIELTGSPATQFKAAIEGLIMIDARGDTLEYDLPLDPACINFVENISTSSPEVPLPPTSVQVWPNPSSGALWIKARSDIQLQGYELIDITGQIVETGRLGEGAQERIDLHAHRLGWYFLRIQTDQGVLTKRVLKIK